MNVKRIIQYILIIFSLIILTYSYYYLPSKNRGSIKVENYEKKIEQNLDEKVKKKNNTKNTFTNTEYKSQNQKGEVFTTRAKESYIFSDQTGLVHLVQPYSFTALKDGSLLEINSTKGLVDKSQNITSFSDQVTIKNKNYIITADLAKHISAKNLIVINGNVIMKDLTLGLSHIVYCDIIEINTITNNVSLFMKDINKKVVSKKFK